MGSAMHEETTANGGSEAAAVGAAVLRMFVDAGFGTEEFGRLRCVVTRANGVPAVAAYVRREGEPAWTALAMDVLRIEEGAIAEILTFGPEVFASFGLAPTLENEVWSPA